MSTITTYIHPYILIDFFLLVKSHHAACYSHIHRDLRRHSPNKNHLLAGVRMERRVIYLLSSPQLIFCKARNVIPFSTTKINKPHHVEYCIWHLHHSKCKTMPYSLFRCLVEFRQFGVLQVMPFSYVHPTSYSVLFVSLEEMRSKHPPLTTYRLAPRKYIPCRYHYDFTSAVGACTIPA